MKLLRCGCDWDGESVHYCPTRPEPIYQDVAKVWRHEPAGCQCDLPRYRRHTDPWDCIPQHEIDMWRAYSGCSQASARHLYWLYKNFRR